MIVSKSESRCRLTESEYTTSAFTERAQSAQKREEDVQAKKTKMSSNNNSNKIKTISESGSTTKLVVEMLHKPELTISGSFATATVYLET